MSEFEFCGFAANLACLLVHGSQTNPFIKDYLKQFPGMWDPNAADGEIESSDGDDYESLESGFKRDDAISRINRKLAENDDEYVDGLYRKLDTKAPTAYRTKFHADLEREAKMKKKDQKAEILRARHEQNKPTTKKDLLEAEREHIKLLNKYGGRRYVEEKEPDKKEIAKMNREKQEQFAASALRTNKLLLPKTTKPDRSKPEKEEKAPPRAADLTDFTRRINQEVKELTEFYNLVQHDLRMEVDVNGALDRIEDIEAAADESHVPDYHMRFAMLFQKLENAEQKIRDLEEKAEVLQ